MPPKPNARSWSDIQIAIATVAIVATLGLWNLFAEPLKTSTPPDEPLLPPSEPPPAASIPTPLPRVKIMFTQVAPQNTIIQQVVSHPQKKKKKKDDNSGGGSSVTQTRTS